MRLPYALIEPLIEQRSAERLVEVRGAAGSGTAGYRYALTDLGRERARQYLDINALHRAPAPVPLASYVDVDARAGRGARLHRSRAPEAGLLAPDRRPTSARAARPGGERGKAIFLYGPPGNGKTVIAEGMGRAARRRHVRAARDRRRRPDRHDVRSDQPRAARRRAEARSASWLARRAIAAGCGSAARSSWSAAS